MIQLWGECVPPDVLERNGTLSEEEIEGRACSSDSFCQEGDINALCFQVEEGEEGVCKCRQEMQWNSAALECQVESLGLGKSFNKKLDKAVLLPPLPPQVCQKDKLPQFF